MATRAFIVSLIVPDGDDLDSVADQIHDALEDDGFEVSNVHVWDSPQEGILPTEQTEQTETDIIR